MVVAAGAETVDSSLGASSLPRRGQPATTKTQHRQTLVDVETMAHQQNRTTTSGPMSSTGAAAMTLARAATATQANGGLVTARMLIEMVVMGRQRRELAPRRRGSSPSAWRCGTWGNATATAAAGRG